MLFRPPEYLDDVRERELEIKAMEQRLAHDQPPTLEAGENLAGQLTLHRVGLDQDESALNRHNGG